MQRFPEVQAYAERAERAFEHVPFRRPTSRRLAFVKATTLQMDETRGAEAVALAREVSEMYLLLGATPRTASSRIVEAAMLFEQGAVERAMELWQSLEGNRPWTSGCG